MEFIEQFFNTFRDSSLEAYRASAPVGRSLAYLFILTEIIAAAIDYGRRRDERGLWGLMKSLVLVSVVATIVRRFDTLGPFMLSAFDKIAIAITGGSHWGPVEVVRYGLHVIEIYLDGLSAFSFLTAPVHFLVAIMIIGGFMLLSYKFLETWWGMSAWLTLGLFNACLGSRFSWKIGHNYWVLGLGYGIQFIVLLAFYKLGYVSMINLVNDVQNAGVFKDFKLAFGGAIVLNLWIAVMLKVSSTFSRKLVEGLDLTGRGSVYEVPA